MQGGSNRLLTLEEAAERLGVSERVVRENRHRWGLRSLKVGKFIKIRECDLDDWIERQTEAA